jgi:hypothetical protein
MNKPIAILQEEYERRWISRQQQIIDARRRSMQDARRLQEFRDGLPIIAGIILALVCFGFALWMAS